MADLDADHFLWNDGGRAASGFVGSTGDCVIRAIAIATGHAYKEVYDRLKESSGHSPREGMARDVYGEYLQQRGWQCEQLPTKRRFDVGLLPKGVVIVRLQSSADARRHRSHLCCVVGQIVHDTWCPAEDDYEVTEYWLHPDYGSESTSPIIAPKRNVSKAEEMTQAEFEKVLRRLRALDRTARNEASTEGERRNALRALQTMMLANNLTREDIAEEDNVDGLSFARISCHVNGTRAYRWENRLAHYICKEVFTSVQNYTDTNGRRTRTVFYGPVADVRNAIQLYRELLLTIALMAHRKYGGYARGSGASYCEGYVAGLPRNESVAPEASASVVSATALIQTRLLAIRESATDWLHAECGIKLCSVSRSSRYGYDSKAAGLGRIDGARHTIEKPNAMKRIEAR